MPAQSVQTTLALPTDLLEAADRVIRDGKVRSRDELIATALRHELEALRRAEIDAAFAPPAADLDHQAEARTLDAEFATAGWETLQHASN